MASLPTLSDDGIALTHFIVAADVERAGRFYSDVLGGEIVLAGRPTIVALANSWIIINVGGGPTDDKPSVILEPPQNPDRVSSFLNIRVADIQTIYKTWSVVCRLVRATVGISQRLPDDAPRASPCLAVPRGP